MKKKKKKENMKQTCRNVLIFPCTFTVEPCAQLNPVSDLRLRLRTGSEGSM
jgi:hypothetical protein